jgi:hypothetical protein
MTLAGLISHYLPTNQVKASKARIFEVLVEILNKPELPDSVKSSIVDSLWSFLSD